MERLTINEIIEHCDRNTRMYEKACDVKYLETSTMNNSIKGYWEHKQVAEYLRKFKDYEDLEEQGRLLKLPCKVGDTLYWINGKFIINYKITGFSVDEDGVWIMHAEHCVKTINKPYLYNIAVDTIGETTFFSESEAEAKLKELRNNND